MKIIAKSSFLLVLFLILGFYSVQAKPKDATKPRPSIISEVYVAEVGWKYQETYDNIIESVKLTIDNPIKGMEIRYKAHIENIGWTDWVYNGEHVGTPGSELKIEAIKIELVGNCGDYELLYKVHIQQYGYHEFSGNGNVAGTVGCSRGINGLIVKLVDNETFNENFDKNAADLDIKPNSKILDVPIVCQRPELPTGCEITAVTMMLKYYGADVDKIRLAYEMPYHRSNPDLGYVGNPFLKTGWTINPPALCKLVRKYTGSEVNLTGSTCEAIENQIYKNKPVVAYVKIHGFNVHAITITGYDEKKFYYNDPWTGEKNEAINKNTFLGLWKTQGKRAISY